MAGAEARKELVGEVRRRGGRQITGLAVPKKDLRFHTAWDGKLL